MSNELNLERSKYATNLGDNCGMAPHSQKRSSAERRGNLTAAGDEKTGEVLGGLDFWLFAVDT